MCAVDHLLVPLAKRVYGISVSDLENLVEHDVSRSLYWDRRVSECGAVCDQDSHGGIRYIAPSTLNVPHLHQTYMVRLYYQRRDWYLGWLHMTVCLKIWACLGKIFVP